MHELGCKALAQARSDGYGIFGYGNCYASAAEQAAFHKCGSSPRICFIIKCDVGARACRARAARTP